MLPFIEVISTDACLTGCGGTGFGYYFHLEFPAEIGAKYRNNISGLELLAIIIAVKVWVQKSKNRFVVSCDNKAAVFAINAGRIRDPNILACLRELWYYAAVYQFDVRAIHVPGVNNTIPDY